MPQTDSALLKRWVSLRDAEAFTQIIDRHAAMVYGTCRRVMGNAVDAEDAAQDCFLKLSQAERSIAPSLGGWLHRVATNAALDRLKSQGRRKSREERFAASLPANHEPVWNDIQPYVDEAIAGLPEDLQAPLVLHFLEGRTHREAARVLGLSRSTVSGRIQRAVAALRQDLEAKGVTIGLAALVGLFESYDAQAAPAPLVASLNKIGLAASRPLGLGRRLLDSRLAMLVAAVAVVLTPFAVMRALPNPASESATGSSFVEAGTAVPVAVLESASSASDEEGESVPPAEVADEEMEEVQALENPLRLRCVDGKGHPVEGAEVYYVHGRLGTPPMTWQSLPEHVSQFPYGPHRSDSEGYVEVPALSDETEEFGDFYMAYAVKPGQMVGMWNHSPRAKKNRGWDHIVMGPSTRIRGTVTVPEGYDPTAVTLDVLTLSMRHSEPPFGSSFSASNKDRPPIWPELFSTSPRADGTFELMDMPAGQSMYLAFTGPGLGERQFYTFDVKGEEPVSIEMVAEAAISGTVRYTHGGPAVNVPVFARPYGGPGSGVGVNEPFLAHTDSLGRYRIKGLPKEVYSVKVQHYGEPSEWISGVIPVLTTEPGATLEGVNLVLERGALQEGVALEEETGRPIPDLYLVAMNPGDVGNFSRAQSIGTSRTNADGKFSFRLPTGVSFLYFFALPEDIARPDQQGKTFVTVGPGETVKPPLTFRLARKTEQQKRPAGRATLEGRVVDVDGQPLAGVPVAAGRKYMQGAAARQEQSPSGSTESDGRFSISVTAQGEHRIVAGGKGFSRTESEWFTVEAGETRSLPEFVVELYPEMLTVTVVYPDGESSLLSTPSVGVQLKESGGYITSGMPDSHGRVELLVPDAPLILVVSQDGFKPVITDVEPGFEYEVELEREEPFE